jgi:hypothetical protein
MQASEAISALSDFVSAEDPKRTSGRGNVFVAGP